MVDVFRWGVIISQNCPHSRSIPPLLTVSVLILSSMSGFLIEPNSQLEEGTETYDRMWTDAPDEILNSEVWTSEESPYYANSSVSVREGATLTIEQGVTVYLDSSVSIDVWGASMDVQGSQEQPVVFAPRPGLSPETPWGGITVMTDMGPEEAPSSLSMSYAILEGAENAVRVDTQTMGAPSATASLHNTVLLNNGCGVYASDEGGVSVHESIFISSDYCSADSPQSPPVASIYDSTFIGSNLTFFGGNVERNLIVPLQYEGAPSVFVNGFLEHPSSRFSWNCLDESNFNFIMPDWGDNYTVSNNTFIASNSYFDPQWGSHTNGLPARLKGNNFIEFSDIALVIGAEDVDLTHNWWNTTDTTVIEDIIWDDDGGGIVEYLPIMTSKQEFPCQDAGAELSWYDPGPISIPNVVQYGQTLSAGGRQTCGIMDNGTVHCWGSGASTIGPGAAPINAISISAGAHHTCAILENGSVPCWGQGEGRLGRQNNPVGSDSPWPAMDQWWEGAPASSITQISAGGTHTCVIISDGSVYCTGKNNVGQLGLGNETTQDIYRLTKTSLPNGSHAISISAGDVHTCAVLQNGSVYCWGLQVTAGGQNSESGIPEMVEFPEGYSHSAISVSAGVDHTCVILQNGSAMCWGSDDKAQLGNSQHVSSSTPLLVDELPEGSTVSSIATGDSVTCATLSNRSLYCWGLNNYGQLGSSSGGGTPSQPSLPPGMAVLSVSVGPGYNSGKKGHVCAILENGSAMCWGVGTDGQLGYTVDDVDQWSYTPGYSSLPPGRTLALPGPSVQHQPFDSDSDGDSDGDGVADEADDFPDDPNEQLDTDADGVGDNADAFPMDSTEQLDTDEDGFGDNADHFPLDNTEWIDSDSDGVGDNADSFPMDSTEQLDTDGDGVGDNADPDPNDSNVTTGELITIVDGEGTKITIVGFEFDWRTIAIISISIVTMVIAYLIFRRPKAPPTPEEVADIINSRALLDDDPYGSTRQQPQTKLFLTGGSRWDDVAAQLPRWRTFNDNNHLDEFTKSVMKINQSQDATNCAKYVRASLNHLMRHIVKVKIGEYQSGERELSGYETHDATYICNEISKERGKKKALKNQWEFGKADLHQVNASHKRCSQHLHPDLKTTGKSTEYTTNDADIAATAVLWLKHDLDL